MGDQVRLPAGARRERASGAGQGVPPPCSGVAIGPDIGAGFVRPVALGAVMAATIRLALGVAAAGRAR
jgi:hypothetical protein